MAARIATGGGALRTALRTTRSRQLLLLRAPPAEREWRASAWGQGQAPHQRCQLLQARCFSQPAAEPAQEDKEKPEVQTEDESTPQSGNSPSPLKLWTARSLEKEMNTTESALSYWTALTSGGLGLLLLGVAPFSPPAPFMVGLILVVGQVRLAHALSLRQLRAQARRHVLELTLIKESEEMIVLGMKCEGGIERTLCLAADTDKDKPTMAEVFQKGGDFLYLDSNLRIAEDEGALARVQESELSITKEEISIESTFPEEASKDEVRKLVQPLVNLSKDNLDKLKESSAPRVAFAKLERAGRLVAGAVLAGGAVVFTTGRYAASRDD